MLTGLTAAFHKAALQFTSKDSHCRHWRQSSLRQVCVGVIEFLPVNDSRRPDLRLSSYRSRLAFSENCFYRAIEYRCRLTGVRRPLALTERKATWFPANRLVTSISTKHSLGTAFPMVIPIFFIVEKIGRECSPVAGIEAQLVAVKNPPVHRHGRESHTCCRRSGDRAEVPRR